MPVERWRTGCWNTGMMCLGWRMLTPGWKIPRSYSTTDQDFEEMIWREKRQHEGVLRLENLPRVERLSLLEYVLNHHSQDLASGVIIIASSRKIRIRKPVASD